MMYFSGFGLRGVFGLKPAQCAVMLSALALASCSADVTRFDNASFNLNDSQDASPPVPKEPVRNGISDNVAHSTPRGPYGAGAKSVEVSQLSEPVTGAPSAPLPPVASAPAAPMHQAQPFRGAQPSPAVVAAAPQAAPVAKGDLIEVQPGDTLYNLSKRHKVSLAQMMQLNSLSSTNLKPGQKLYLPQGVHAAPTRVASLSPSAAAPAAAPLPVSADVAERYGATYTVKAGDSLYGIARAHKANYAELQQVNGISDPRKVRPGAVLKVPGAGTPTQAPVAAAAPMAPPAAEPETPAPAIASTTQPTVINHPKQMAALSDKTSDANPPAATFAPAAPAASAAAPKQDKKVAAAAPQAQAQAAQAAAGDSVKLRWPATGKVIAGFGGRPDGTHNDGINLSVPLGTEVHAAESGVVAYAGSELKGYGNLVLIRHDNGWVTAYAHNDELVVKRGDKIKRGQVIAKAGKTGTVDQPQVHFELRQGSKPVDPTPFMEKL